MCVCFFVFVDVSPWEGERGGGGGGSSGRKGKKKRVVKHGAGGRGDGEEEEEVERVSDWSKTVGGTGVTISALEPLKQGEPNLN